jgi:PAS domain S-box-containing protein
MQSIGDAVIVTDTGARITRINPVAEILTGWVANEAQGRPLTEVFRIVNESTRQTVENPVEKVCRNGTVVGLANHTILVSRTGTEINIDDSAAPIVEDDGKLSGIVLIFRDIRERRLHEQERETLFEEVNKRYAELEATYNNAAIAMALIDATDFRYLRVNPKLCEMLNLSQEEITGSKVSDVAANVPGLEDALRTVAAGQPVAGGLLEGELSTSPGIKRFWTMDYTPVFGRDGEVVAIAAASAEITRQKHAEAILIRNEKLAAVGRLAASIAHEINNPLEALTNVMYLIRGYDLPTEVRGYLDIAERELSRVSAISSQTLRFHKQTTKPTEVGAEQLILEVLSLYQGRLANSRVSVVFCQRTDRKILCMEGEIRQVINNLVSNALDAIQAKEGRIIVRVREGSNQRTRQKMLVVTVADNGSGISAEVAKQIFEPFFSTKGHGGTGLGLWISREIVERHRGTLSVRSSQRSVTSGTVFTMRLPFDADFANKLN